MMIRRTVPYLFTILVGAVFFLNIYCTSSNDTVEQTTPQYAYPNHHDTVNYVGMQTCAGCHQDKLETFVHTGMGQSFDSATWQKTAAKFSKEDLVYDPYVDMYYHPYFKDSMMYIMEFRLEGKDTTHKRIERIDYIIGSGQHTNSHMMNINGFVYQAPITWYAQKGKWDLPPGYEDGNNIRFSRLIDLECISCHNALPNHVNGSINKFASMPKGIDCERCHGPGEMHVNAKRSGQVVDVRTQMDSTIINPRKLPWKLQIDVCQRCHLQGNAVLKPGKTFYDFRPGMKLSDVVDVFLPRYEGADDEFIMASHADRLQMSECFIQSNKGFENSNEPQTLQLTCITCHNPHVSVKETKNTLFNNACRNCHDGGKACTEEQTLRLQVQDNCVQCHMPRSGTEDIPHVSVHDHYIRKPVEKEEIEQLKTFVRLEAINNPQTDALTTARGYINYYEKFEQQPYYLDSAERFLGMVKEESELKTITAIHLAYNQQDNNKIISLGEGKTFNHAWTNYRIGQAYMDKKEYSKAEPYMKAAVTQMPYYLEFKHKYASLLVSLNKIDKAKAELEELLAMNPKHERSLTTLGYVYFLQNNLSAAKKHYTMALALSPDYEQALMNMAGLYSYVKDYKKAKVLFQQVLKKNPQNTLAKQQIEALNKLITP